MKDLLQKLVEERGRATHTLNELVQSTYDEKTREQRDFTSEERERFDKIDADITDLDGRIKQLHDRLESETSHDELRSKIDRIVRPAEAPVAPEDSLDARALAFFRGEGANVLDVPFAGLEIERDKRSNLPTGRILERRTGLVTGTANVGGDLVPTSFRAVLYEHLINNSAIRQTGATILTTNSGEALLLPKTTAHPAAGTIVAEAAVINENDPTFGQGTLNSYKYANIVQISSELVADSGVDVLGYLARRMGEALGNGSGADMVTGDGSSKPQGVVPAAGTVAQLVGGTGTSGVPTYVELIKLYDKVKPGYQRNAVWFMNQATLSHLRQLVDSNGRSLVFGVDTGMATPFSESIFGKRIVVDPNVPDTAVNGTSVLFGDFSPYFIRDVNGLRFERSVDYAFNKDLVTYRAILRTDGDLLDLTGAIGNYKGGTA